MSRTLLEARVDCGSRQEKVYHLAAGDVYVTSASSLKHAAIYTQSTWGSRSISVQVRTNVSRGRFISNELRLQLGTAVKAALDAAGFALPSLADVRKVENEFAGDHTPCRPRKRARKE